MPERIASPNARPPRPGTIVRVRVGGTLTPATARHRRWSYSTIAAHPTPPKRASLLYTEGVFFCGYGCFMAVV
jgi:hypothetical protein